MGAATEGSGSNGLELSVEKRRDKDGKNELPSYERCKDDARGGDLRKRFFRGRGAEQAVNEEDQVECLDTSNNPTERSRFVDIFAAQAIRDVQLQEGPSNEECQDHKIEGNERRLKRTRAEVLREAARIFSASQFRHYSKR